MNYKFCFIVLISYFAYENLLACINAINKYFMVKVELKKKNRNSSEFDENSDDSDEQKSSSDQQESKEIQQLSDRQDSNQQSEESPPVEPALKSMNFRPKRGSKMKDLMKGKIEKDQFWEKNNIYFGGDLKGKDEDQHQSEYQASSSGRDEFDSDFDLTDSYPGKRGRKKGQKVKRKLKRDGASRPRGRPKKVKEESQHSGQQQQQKSKSDSQIQHKKKRIYKQVPIKSNDVFVVYKAIQMKKKHSKISKKTTGQLKQDKDKHQEIQQE